MGVECALTALLAGRPRLQLRVRMGRLWLQRGGDQCEEQQHKAVLQAAATEVEVLLGSGEAEGPEMELMLCMWVWVNAHHNITRHLDTIPATSHRQRTVPSVKPVSACCLHCAAFESHQHVRFGPVTHCV